jgi:uncharacterized protein (TIGR02172 family)
MNYEVTEGGLVVLLEGRVDSGNAAAFEAELLPLAAEHPDLVVELDATGLQYISSAGLRVVMRLLKQHKAGARVTNANAEVYDVFEVTGFSELIEVSKALREVSVEGCDLIGSGGFGRVYRTDPETIVKVYNDGITLDMVQHERDTAQKAFLAGVPTAISYDVVRCGKSYGVVYELLNAKTVAQIMDSDRSRVGEMGRKSAGLLKQLHEIRMNPGALPDRKAEFLAWLPNVAPILEPAEVDEIRAFIESVPDRDTFLHGDFNSKNIMVQDDGEFVLIDIGDAALGHPVFDVAGMILPYVFLTRSQYPEEEKHRLMGFCVEDGPKMWEAICGAYFGASDAGKVQRITGELMPFAQLMSSYQGTRRCGFDRDYMTRVSLLGIRQRLLPLIRSARPLDW